MGQNVFANMMEISGKASDNKSIAAMPDVCLSPPSPPAGPIPIPYPNTAMASDMTGGSKTVKIGGEEVGLKNKSKYKQSNGDEPATNSFGGGLLSHKITGALYFSAWSFDVKFEGSNVTRFGDLTTGNHTNTPETGNGAVTSSIAGLATAQEGIGGDCSKLRQANTEARQSMQTARRKGDRRFAHKGVRTAGNKNSVITHAVYTPAGGSPRIMRACSDIAAEKYDDSFSKYPGKKKGPSKMNKEEGCGPHTYKLNRALPDTCHTEARMMEEIFSAPGGKGGSLLLAVNWPSPKPGRRPCDPCERCNELICAASKCMTIEICNEKGKKEPACRK
jgi:hypothetical protein